MENSEARIVSCTAGKFLGQKKERRGNEEVVRAYNSRADSTNSERFSAVTAPEDNKDDRIDAVRFADTVCRWQLEKGRRNLPWFTEDPYRRWLSEIMLQQTQVSVVREYFARFLEAFPTVEDLAGADSESVMRLWAGLGYYSRARNLHKAAGEVAQAGRFPRTAREWEKLPGVGGSTAAALASFCSGEAAGVCDGNVKRVLARLYALEEPVDRPRTARFLKEEANRLVSRTSPGTFNQAMMDLGAMICTRSSPRCSECPVSDCCRAHALGKETDYPKKTPPKARKRALVHALLCVEKDEAGHRVWLVRRQNVERGMGHWKGLWSLPETEHPQGREIARIEHVMSHVTLELAVHAAGRGELPADAFAVDVSELADAPLPAPVEKLLSTLVFDRQLL